jgi:hypothetical protein
MTPALSDGGSIVVGLVLAVVAGGLSGSWNASFSETHGLAVGRNNNTNEENKNNDLHYHLAWVLFQWYAAIVNIPICLYLAGGVERVNYIVQHSSATSISLIIVFSILWGVGSVGFGLACKIAGVGLGTNLTMGVITILGTFLPLCLDGAIATAAGGVVVAGLVVCCVGLVFSVKSLQTRDRDEQQLKTVYKTEEMGLSVKGDQPNDLVILEHKGGDESSNSAEGSPGVVMELDEERTHESSIIIEEANAEKEYSSWQKVGICVVAGIFSTQLQFAFVFGDELIDLAASEEGPGSTPRSGTSAVIWLFAISLGAPVSILYGLYNSPAHISWSVLWTCPWYRHVLILLTTSIPWVSHIHLYGYSNTYLPDDLAASVAWPILMMVTVVTGMLWSIGLGEWTTASMLARRQLYKGLAIVALGVATIMASMAVP